MTGSFDNWAKTIKLDKKDVVHEKTVPLSVTSVPILYKVGPLRVQARHGAFPAPTRILVQY